MTIAIPILTGQAYYYFPAGGPVSGDQSVGQWQVQYVAMWLPSGATVDRIGCEVTSGGSESSIRLGIYSDDGTGFPKALLLDAGTETTEDTGFAEITVAYEVPADDLYWLAALPMYDVDIGSEATYRTIHDTNFDYAAASMLMGGVSSGFLTPSGQQWAESRDVGDDTFPDPASGPFAVLDRQANVVRPFVKIT